MRYRLVCLDAGFTLLSPRAGLDVALGSLLREQGHEPTEEELRRAWEAADRWFWDEYHRPDNATWTDDASIVATWRDYHGRMLDELGVDDRAAIVERILGGQFSPESWEAYPDVEPLLEALDAFRADGRLRVGIVSDWNSDLRGIFAALDLERHLDFVLASAAVGLAKPDPAFFRMALDRAGAAPHEAVMIGDSYRADVEGARAAGMDAILLDRAGEAGPADVPVVRSLAELGPLLDIAPADARPTVDAER